MSSPAQSWSRTGVAACALIIVLGAIALFAAHHPAPAPAMFPKPGDSFFHAGPIDLALERDLANAYFDHQHYSAAADAYRRLLASQPSDINARINLATALWQLHQPDEALRELDAALHLDPNNPLALDRVGTIELFDKHDAPAAAVAFQRLITIAPNYSGKARVSMLLAGALKNAI